MKAQFPLFDRVEVNGAHASPIFQYLKLHSGEFGTASKLGSIGWNFGKFLVDRKGDVVAYYGPRTKPKDFEEAIAKLVDDSTGSRDLREAAALAWTADVLSCSHDAEPSLPEKKTFESWSARMHVRCRTQEALGGRGGADYLLAREEGEKASLRLEEEGEERRRPIAEVSRSVGSRE